MSWNHRVVRRMVDLPNGETELAFGVHEVYYDEHGEPTSITDDPVAPFGENVVELQEELVLFVKAAELPVLNYEDF